MTKWEYKTIEAHPKGPILLQILGDQGWELVSVSEENKFGLVTYYLKREKQ